MCQCTRVCECTHVYNLNWCSLDSAHLLPLSPCWDYKHVLLWELGFELRLHMYKARVCPNELSSQPLDQTAEEKKYVNEPLSKTALYNLRISVFKAEGSHSHFVCSRERKSSHPSTEKAGKEPWLVRGQHLHRHMHGVLSEEHKRHK